MFDLQDIVSSFLDSDETPEFVRECQKLVMNKVEIYTAKITNQFGMNLQELVEMQAVELLDSISDTNCIYFKKGMAAGVVLLLQLLEF